MVLDLFIHRIDRSLLSGHLTLPALHVVEASGTSCSGCRAIHIMYLEIGYELASDYQDQEAFHSPFVTPRVQVFCLGPRLVPRPSPVRFRHLFPPRLLSLVHLLSPISTKLPRISLGGGGTSALRPLSSSGRWLSRLANQHRCPICIRQPVAEEGFDSG